MSDFGSTTPVRLERSDGKGLAAGTLGLWGSTVIGLASTAPVYSLVATLGFVVFGWAAEGRPPLSLGWVNVPAALVMGTVTGLVAPWGALLAHRLPKRTLRRSFAIYLLIAAGAVVAKAL